MSTHAGTAAMTKAIADHERTKRLERRNWNKRKREITTKVKAKVRSVGTAAIATAKAATAQAKAMATSAATTGARIAAQQAKNTVAGTVRVGSAGASATTTTLKFTGRKSLEAMRKWIQTYRELLEVDADLPPIGADCWKDPVLKMKTLQDYLGLKFDVPAQSAKPDIEFCKTKPPKCDVPKNHGRAGAETAAGKATVERRVQCSPGLSSITLDAYQLAMIAPFARVNEMLIVSGTGTGKSQMYMQALAALPGVQQFLTQKTPDLSKFPDFPKCYVICPDDEKAYAQFAQELCKAPGWESVRDRMHLFVSLGTQTRNKLINFVKYTTAGGICMQGGATSEGKGKLTKCEFDNGIIVMDEVHVLVTLQDIAASQVRKVLAMAQWLRARRYKKFLALTATPPVTDFGRLSTLFNYFLPDSKQLAVTESVQLIRKESSIKGLVVVKTELNEFIDEQDVDDHGKKCRVGGLRKLNPAFRQKLEGLNVCMYASDRDGARFPAFEFETPKVIPFAVPNILSQPESKSKSPKPYVEGLRYMHDRLKKIAKAWAPMLTNGVTSEFNGLNPNKKTLIFLSQHDTAVEELYNEIRKSSPNLNVKRLLSKSTDFNRTISEFNCEPRGGCIVANTKYATGYTFWGVVELHQILPVSAELDMQLVGRVRRFCSHGALPAGEWKVQHYIWEPKTLNKDDKVTCERVLADYVSSEKLLLRNLLATLWDVSFTKKCFYRNPPDVVKNSESFERQQKTWQEEWAAIARKYGGAVFSASKEAFTPTWRPYARKVPLVGGWL